MGTLVLHAVASASARLARALAPLLLVAGTVLAPTPTDAQPAAALAPEEDPTLAGQIDLLLDQPLFEDATVGVHVYDLESGETLYARGADLPLNPASNVKLFTTAAALLVHGPEHRYATRLLRGDGALAGSVLSGDVYFKGSGDPNLVTEDLLVLAAELRARGIRKITGGVVVDASAFDQDELPPGFDQKNELASYRAPSGAASVNFNTFVVRAAPGAKAGAAALVGLDPPIAGIKLINKATTAEGRRRKLFADVEAKGSTIEITFRGTIGEDASAGRYRYPVVDPSRNAGNVLVYALRQNGIKLGRRTVKVGKAPRDARALATHFSDPLSLLIRSVNKFSNNFMAEQVLKTLAPAGAPASFEAAVSAERTALERLGVDLNGARLTNGSGLYDTNRVTPQHVTTLLAKMFGDFRYRADYLASLAVMGVDGTTRSRLADTDATRWVRVKTGTLDGISALSGYAGAKGRKPIVFSVLFNDLPQGATGAARTVQNDVALLVSRFAAGRPLRPAGAEGVPNPTAKTP
ncbi:MAG: D-alanyl-D-alanine carboxypeptidase/D-alanyl-D-alanine-endopeptidase [Myxococcota bacterium]